MRIDVITYVSTPANDPPSATIVLSVYYRYYRSGPSTGYRNIRRTSGYPFYCTGTVYFALVVDPRDPPLDLWDGIPPGISSRRGSLLLRWVPRKNFIAKSPADPSRSPQMMGVRGPAGEIKIFKNVVLAHYLDY